MKKIFALVIALVMVLCAASALADGIKVGIINLDPAESGYRQANVKNLTDTFTAENGYDATFVTAPTADKQLDAFKSFITLMTVFSPERPLLISFPTCTIPICRSQQFTCGSFRKKSPRHNMRLCCLSTFFLAQLAYHKHQYR